ncbi:MAG: hydrogenase 4 subunit B [Patescibacteria group bacterium]|jgi:hydrogenase-4 component B
MFSSSLAQFFFFSSLIALIIGALGSLWLRKNDHAANLWGNTFSMVGAITGLIASVTVLLFGATFSYSSGSSLSLLTLSFNIDKLAAFFIFIITLISLCASIYALGYVKHYYKQYSLGALGFFYNLFIAGMILVVSASNTFFFLIVWEIMSLASYFLVIFEHKEKDNIKAGSLYFIMTHIGTAFIMCAFLLLYQATGSFDFLVIKGQLGNVSPLIKNIIFILSLLGFGTKAGIIPVHIWLPKAHPASPSHVSALMSGVMIKTGVYMFIRIFIDLMPNVPLWWGIIIIIIGSISALLGVLYALTEHDIKKLLAYHSIENIGIILLGLGSSLVFLALDMKSLAMLGLVAALFHTLNHAIFKALLFLGAGSVILKMKTRNIEAYGGIIKYMPQTAFFFLIGSIAISALPPFNGFFSEWITFQTLFSGIRSLDVSVQWIFLLAAGALAFTGGLAAACFVKAFGTTFLARPRSEAVRQTKEVSLSLRIGMAILAVLTLLIGLFSGAVTAILLSVIANLNPFYHVNGVVLSNLSSVSLQDGFAAVSVPTIFISLVLAMVMIFFIVHRLTRDRTITKAATWDCGTQLGSRMEITATGFARSIITIFSGILKPTKQTGIEYHDVAMRYVPKPMSVKLEIEDVYGTYFYQPIIKVVTKISEQMKKIQSGSVNIYVLYLFISLMILLVFLVI